VDYSYLGRTGVQVSRLCLGTVNFGWATAEDEAFMILDRAHELGVNFLDTADSYGGSLGKGGTETLIGHWFAQGGGRRERTVLATKVYNPMSDWPNHGKLSGYHIRQACDASLRRLGTDRIDVYQMHYYDSATPLDEVWEAMETLNRQGKVVYFGVSNFASWQVVAAHEAGRRRGMLGIASDQSEYSLLARDIEREVIPACAAHGIGVNAWSPLHGGLLGGVLTASGDGGRRSSERTAGLLNQHIGQIKAYESLCREIGTAPAVVALAWLLGRDSVTAAVIGPRIVTQLDGAATALACHLPDDALARLDEIFPGSGPAQVSGRESTSQPKDARR
jgi:aryl-alcohol dehydrogenase-like predicted oxidoreductase